MQEIYENSINLSSTKFKIVHLQHQLLICLHPLPTIYGISIKFPKKLRPSLFNKNIMSKKASHLHCSALFLLPVDFFGISPADVAGEYFIVLIT